MSDVNQIIYLNNFYDERPSSVVIIGSKDNGNVVNFSNLFPDSEILGIDIEPGPGVDVVHDITKDTEDLGEHDLVICCSVMEHVDKPWEAALNIAKMVKPLGHVFLSVPWIWRYHPYPDDYWRMSVSGLKVLFPGFSWCHEAYSTNVPGEIFMHSTHGITKDFSLKNMIGSRKYLPYMNSMIIGQKHEV